MREPRASAILSAVLATIALSSGCGGGEGGGGGPPSAPTGLSAAAANGSVSLTWTVVSSATSYNVYRATSTGTLSTKTKISSPTGGTCLDSAVSNGTTYYYQVTAVNGDGESGGSSEVSATPMPAPPPPAPTGVTASAGNGAVVISWTPVSAATSYNIYWSTTAGVTPGTGTKIATPPYVGSTYLQTGLTNGTTYYYVVTAQNATGESAPSSQVSATPSAAPYILAKVMTWMPSAPPNAPVLAVRVCTDSTGATPVTNATVTVNGTTLTYVAASQEYQAPGPMPAQGAAVTLSVTIPSGGAVRPGTYTASGTQYSTFPTVTSPTSGTTWVSASDNTVTWTAGAPTAITPASEYVVGIQDTSTGTFYPVNPNNDPVETAISNLSYTLPASSITTAGSYVVFVGIATAGIPTGGIPIWGAATGSGLVIGGISPIVPITVQPQVPPAPPGVSASAGNGSATISWTSVSGASSYNVYWSTTAGVTPANGTKIADATSPYIQTGLTNGTTYYYVVTAVNTGGESAPSPQVSATPFQQTLGGAQQWVARVDGPVGGNTATAIAVDPSGNSYVTGYICTDISASLGSCDAWSWETVKYSASGVSQWTATFAGPGGWMNAPAAIAVDAAGNVYVTGEQCMAAACDESGCWSCDSDYATIKYDSSGNQLWLADYKGPGGSGLGVADQAQAIALDGSGHVFVTGASVGTDGLQHYATIKYNADGTVAWVARYDGPGAGTDIAFAIALDSSGNVLVTGGSTGTGTGLDYATVKYSATGTQLWVARYNGPASADDFATALGVDDSGNVYVTGFSGGINTGNDYATLKYDASGTQLWLDRYDGPASADDRAMALAVDPTSGSVYLTGRSTGNGSSYDYATLGYDANGNRLWTVRYNGPGNGSDMAYAIVLDKNAGRVTVTGGSVGSGTGSDYATVQYDLSGAQVWLSRYDGGGDDFAFGLGIDGGSNIYVTGASSGGYATLSLSSN